MLKSRETRHLLKLIFSFFSIPGRRSFRVRSRSDFRSGQGEDGWSAVPHRHQEGGQHGHHLHAVLIDPRGEETNQNLELVNAEEAFMIQDRGTLFSQDCSEP